MNLSNRTAREGHQSLMDYPDVIGFIHPNQNKNRSQLELLPPYKAAMSRLSLQSYYWLICLCKEGGSLTKAMPSFGGLGLKNQQNGAQLALKLAKLEKIDKDFLHLSGIETEINLPVLDIKPCLNQELEMQAAALTREEAGQNDPLYQKALKHHGEICPGLALGVQMAKVARQVFGELQTEKLTLKVKGLACFADTLQGLAGARIANPCRFIYLGDGPYSGCIWRKDKLILQTTSFWPNLAGMKAQEILEMKSDTLFNSEVTNLSAKKQFAD